ncbi:MAG: MucB/RseB C-terminal domain-containing protein [Hydrogenophilaceae bacterium]|nr:MucB/RseB C-terminal domain-containing protein [Hydrogenophilaceae bacterium]
MRTTILIWTSLALFLALGVQIARAADALEMLNVAREAAAKLDYTGTYFYHHGEHTEVLRVAHRADRHGELHKIEVLDGPHREFLRINDEVFCHMADGKTIRIDRNAVQRFFPAVVPDESVNLSRNYIPRLGGIEKVAGRECRVIILDPRDQFRYTHMIWLDRQTSLPLKTRTVDNHGAQVSMIVFSEIEIGTKPDKSIFDVRMAGKKIQAASLSQAQQPDDGWSISPPPGYVNILKAMRPLHGKKTPVLHRIYSDGISNLSVFIEPIVDGANYLDGLSTESAINIYSRRVSGYKITAMGEVPAAALLETANSVQKR